MYTLPLPINGFRVKVQFGFNLLPEQEAFEQWLEEESYKYEVERITGCYQLTIDVCDYTDAAKIETYIQTH